MGLSEENVQKPNTAGFMHDIGKIGNDESILSKSIILTDSEREEMMRHPEIGYHILNSVSEFSEIAICVLDHHERWDAVAIRLNETCIDARIIAFTHAYAATTCGRAYQSTFTSLEALVEIQACEGTQFDPDFVRLFATEMLGNQTKSSRNVYRE